MKLRTFERRALAIWEAIPASFRDGVTAFVVDPGTYRKEEFEEGWVYGYCEEDAAVAALPGAPVCSRITIFYGSFVNIAADTPDFDWEGELEETIRHELQHHLEWRAGIEDLEVEDWLQDENERRLQGSDFTPFFQRKGASFGDGAWLADHTLFVEVRVPRAAWAGLAGGRQHRWKDLTLTIDPVDAELLEHSPLYAPAEVSGLEDVVWPWDEVVVVLVRAPWWWPW